MTITISTRGAKNKRIKIGLAAALFFIGKEIIFELIENGLIDLFF